tara:strand:+ start:3491 stop:3709 length:219 start_codon:yes stop_codon:yes gene_type:complete
MDKAFTEKTTQSINSIAQSLHTSMNWLTKTLRHSFINDDDRGIVDAIFEVNHSLNNIAQALNNVANAISDKE